MSEYKLPKNKVLVLRVCRADMTSRNGFKWPESGKVKAPDFKAGAECGNGLHGWLWGQGDFSAADYGKDANANYVVKGGKLVPA